MTASLLQTFRAMARNNAWANYRLLSACKALDQEAFAAPRHGYFPSLQATLNHILIVDWFYADALEGGQLGPRAWENEIPCPGIESLLAEQSTIDRRLIAHCEALTDTTLDTFVHVHRSAGVQRERRDRLLLHLFQHQIHHRGQAHGMLCSTPVAPPQLDEFFAEDEAPLRAADFAALGWAEADIWGPDTPTSHPQVKAL